jgi:hypothetical protein
MQNSDYPFSLVDGNNNHVHKQLLMQFGNCKRTQTDSKPIALQ